MAHQLVSSGSPLRPEIGFSRAVRCGPLLAVAGTAPIGPGGQTMNPGDVYGQTKVCLAMPIWIGGGKRQGRTAKHSVKSVRPVALSGSPGSSTPNGWWRLRSIASRATADKPPLSPCCPFMDGHPRHS
jgi:hypothetical protein